MTTLITFLSADISVGFAFSIMMVAILIMAAITQVMQSDYEDTIHVMAKDLDETNERYQDLVYRLFDTIDDLTRHRTNICSSVTADFSFITYTTE